MLRKLRSKWHIFITPPNAIEKMTEKGVGRM